ncbi:hypothetical protein AMTRI_Chr13g121430 [Amborella trichopoda]
MELAPSNLSRRGKGFGTWYSTPNRSKQIPYLSYSSALVCKPLNGSSVGKSAVHFRFTELTMSFYVTMTCYITRNLKWE